MLGSSGVGINFYLETLNGVLLIVSTYLVVSLTYYLLAECKNTSNLLAIVTAIYLDRVGTLLARLAVFTWRRLGSGELGGEMSLNEREVVLTGTVISIVGTVWLVRILLKPKLGEWPWIVPAVLSALFLFIAEWHRLIP